MTENKTCPSVAKTLERLSNHLDMLAGQIFSVEEALGSLLIEQPQNEKISFSKFQSLDFARQSLEDCALLLQFLSKDPSIEVALRSKAEINGKLKLDVTRGILASSHETSNSTLSGDLDLF